MKKLLILLTVFGISFSVFAYSGTSYEGRADLLGDCLRSGTDEFRARGLSLIGNPVNNSRELKYIPLYGWSVAAGFWRIRNFEVDETFFTVADKKGNKYLVNCDVFYDFDDTRVYIKLTDCSSNPSDIDDIEDIVLYCGSRL